MGNGLLKPKDASLIALMMPVYYVTDHTLTAEDISHLRSGWQCILLNMTRPYLRLKETSACNIETCLSWLYNIFYQRLFDVYPTCKPLFSTDPYYQGKFLLRIITTVLADPNSVQYRTALDTLSSELTNKGFRPYELGILGDVLFYSLEQCLGEEGYPLHIDYCWKKAFSHMMHLTIPMCIDKEKHVKIKNTADRRMHVALPDTPSTSMASTSTCC